MSPGRIECPTLGSTSIEAGGTMTCANGHPSGLRARQSFSADDNMEIASGVLIKGDAVGVGTLTEVDRAVGVYP